VRRSPAWLRHYECPVIVSSRDVLQSLNHFLDHRCGDGIAAIRPIERQGDDTVSPLDVYVAHCVPSPA
jgi:hypothetical protein